jgi:hypothetical protein
MTREERRKEVSVKGEYYLSPEALSGLSKVFASHPEERRKVKDLAMDLKRNLMAVREANAAVTSLLGTLDFKEGFKDMEPMCLGAAKELGHVIHGSYIEKAMKMIADTLASFAMDSAIDKEIEDLTALCNKL